METKRTEKRVASAGAGLVAALVLVVASAPTGASAQRAARGAPLLAAAGDIACAPYDPNFNGGRGTPEACKQMATSRLLRGADVVMPVGDTQDEHASMRNLRRVYHPSWGRFLSRTKAVIGNHEYGPPRSPNLGARDYWRYFGERRAGPWGKGWHSFNRGRWHIVALNSMCRESNRPALMQRKVGCGPGSRQLDWLRRDLERNDRRCILAAWHHPRFSSGKPRKWTWREVIPFWQVLQRAGADVVLSGHNHTYERFARLRAGGARSHTGIRQFLVGTGGNGLAKPLRPIARHSVKRVRAFGVLRLRLRARSYEWKFAGIGGRVLDRGSTRC